MQDQSPARVNSNRRLRLSERRDLTMAAIVEIIE
jgi:hypothetical protein